MTAQLEVTIPPELVETIARRAAELVRERAGSPQEPEPEWVMVDVVEQLLPYTRHHVYRLGREGVLETKRVGKYVYFRRASVEALAGGERPASSSASRPGGGRRRRSTAKRRRF
jgi:hypothetical protein